MPIQPPPIGFKYKVASNSYGRLTDWLPRFAMKQARMICLPTRTDTLPELNVGSMNGSKDNDDVGTRRKRTRVRLEYCGQSYKQPKLVIYDFIVVLTRKLPRVRI